MSDYFLRDDDGKRIPNPSYFNIIDVDEAWNWLCLLGTELFTCEYQDLDSREWVFRLGKGYTMSIKGINVHYVDSVAHLTFFDNGDKECVYHVMGDVIPTIESVGLVLLSAIRDYWGHFRGFIGYEFKSIWNEDNDDIKWDEIT